jgi:hypothetical protein
MMGAWRRLGCFSLAAVAESITRRWHAGADNFEPRPNGRTSAEKLLSSRIVQSEAVDRINRLNPYQVEPDRHVVIVVGITGAGKSSTANTFRGGRWHAFQVSDSIVSVRRTRIFRRQILDLCPKCYFASLIRPV